jgi:glycosyltransferase involved in cell wall biosynthesis
VGFLMPPPALRIGGLDLAIRGLADALGAENWNITLLEEGTPLPNAIDLLHIHGIWRPKASRMAREAARKGVPYLVSPHGMLEPWARRSKRLKKSLYFRIIEHRTLTGATTILTTSEQETRNLADFAPGLAASCRSIPLGIDPPPNFPSRSDCRRLLALAEKERILLYLSRIDRKKGLDILLRALAENPSHGIDRLVVVGDGDPSFLQELKLFAAANTTTSLPAINWAGAVWGEQKWAYLKAADLFCLPTHSENFGFAVLEAALMGTPVLTTRNTPWGEWGKHVSDIHVIKQPSIDAISAALSSIMQRPAGDSSTELMQWARENFLWEKVVSLYEKMYQEVSGHASG